MIHFDHQGILAPFYVITRRREYCGEFSFLDASPIDFKDDKERQDKCYSDTSVLENAPGKPPGWKRIRGSFLSLTVLNTTWAANDAHTAPFSQRDVGSVDVMIIPGGDAVGRMHLLRAFLAFADASHLNNPKLPHLQMYRAKAWELIPFDIATNISRTTLDCSGEQYPLSVAHSKVHQGMARVIGFPE
jgi:hypothetical protein